MNVWVCIGSGPSLTAEDVDFCRKQGWSLATCNMGYKIAPDCRLFHAMDSGWWDLVGHDCINTLSASCEVWSGSIEHAQAFHANYLCWDGQQGYSDQHGFAHGGKLSGLQLINIVGWHKPDLVLLLGYDNQPSYGQAHWHPDYPAHMRNSGVIDQDAVDYANLCKSAPFPIINVSRETNIKGIPRAELESIPALIEARLNGTPHGLQRDVSTGSQGLSQELVH